jgi:SanA protein
MHNKTMITFFHVLFWICIAGALILIISRIFVLISTRKSIVALENVPSSPVAIVFGAGLRRDGSPTLILRDRVETAVKLYQSGKVKKILMSGDNRFVDYNEPASMKEYALALGVPEADIVLDFAGRRTYDTCYRAKYIFGVDQAVLVTQQFHLPRAVYTCRSLGMDVVGTPANNEYFRKISILYWNIREIPATLVALWEDHITHPLPVLGTPEPIFPQN